MKSLIQFLAICLLFLSGLATNAQAQRTKRAQTGMKFMAVSPDARASAMGDAVTALEMKSSIAQLLRLSALSMAVSV